MGKDEDKEFEVIVQRKKNKTRLPIIAEDAAEAEALARRLILRRRLGPIIETKEKESKKP